MKDLSEMAKKKKKKKNTFISSSYALMHRANLNTVKNKKKS